MPPIAKETDLPHCPSQKTWTYPPLQRLPEAGYLQRSEEMGSPVFSEGPAGRALKEPKMQAFLSPVTRLAASEA